MMGQEDVLPNLLGWVWMVGCVCGGGGGEDVLYQEEAAVGSGVREC